MKTCGESILTICSNKVPPGETLKSFKALNEYIEKPAPHKKKDKPGQLLKIKKSKKNTLRI